MTTRRSHQPGYATDVVYDVRHKGNNQWKPWELGFMGRDRRGKKVWVCLEQFPTHEAGRECLQRLMNGRA